MKKYKDVVQMRYDNVEGRLSIWDNTYSQLNAVGFNQTIKINKTFVEIFKQLKKLEVDFTQCKMLDVGCGEGSLLRYFAELKGDSDNLYGLDMSKVRIAKADKINPSINYFIGDIVNFSYEDVKFNIITAVDVFMHLNTEDQIMSALCNINNMLSDGGIFIWYDAYWTSHFTPISNDAESCGFSLDEMNNFASKAGFNSLFSKELGKYLLNDVSLNTVYLGESLEQWVISIMEEKLPGVPVNHVVVYEKIKEVGEGIHE